MSPTKTYWSNFIKYFPGGDLEDFIIKNIIYNKKFITIIGIQKDI